jgi:REP element-mobilizing transposase RayT
VLLFGGGADVILAYHVVFSAYGFWLPNDPRGSWSDFVGRWELVRFGKATKVSTMRSVAADEHDRRLREEARKALKYPPVEFTGRQALTVGRGFDRARLEGKYVVYACSILPEHVHVVVGRHERKVGRIAGHLKARATQRLADEGQWPDGNQPVWGHGNWKVYLDTPADVQRAIEYVAANPGQGRQAAAAMVVRDVGGLLNGKKKHAPSKLGG